MLKFASSLPQLTPRTFRRIGVLALMIASYVFAEFSLPGGLVRRLWGKGSDDPGVTVVAEHRGSSYRLVLSTTNCVDITITVDASRENTGSSRPIPFTVATHGQQHIELATFGPLDSSKPWDFHYRYQWLYGCPGALPDDTVYMLPFDPASRHKLLQGAHGTFSHQAGSGNDYANDWDMPEGTVVLAARGGVVVGLRSDSTAQRTAVINGSQCVRSNFVSIHRFELHVRRTREDKTSHRSRPLTIQGFSHCPMAPIRRACRAMWAVRDPRKAS
jgi:hypothetical protein